MTTYRRHLLAGASGGESVAVLTSETHEQSFRKSFAGMVQVKGRVKGRIDASPVPGQRPRGQGYDLKTKVLDALDVVEKVWPANLPNRQVVMPHEVEQSTEAVQFEFENCRVTPDPYEMYDILHLSERDAGRWLLNELRSDYEAAVLKKGVLGISYAFLFRERSGRFLAHAEMPMTLPLLDADSLHWEWRIDGDSPRRTLEACPTCLEAFDAEGRLILRWYVRGGQVRERVLLDPNTIVRLRV
jgi:hypothetical protein